MGWYLLVGGGGEGGLARGFPIHVCRGGTHDFRRGWVCVVGGPLQGRCLYEERVPPVYIPRRHAW